MNTEKRIAVVPGSFDPITNGHVSIIERAVEAYDEVYVAVMINSAKSYTFSLSQREEIAKACFVGRDNVKVISSDGWLWELARDLEAIAIVKGYRNGKDLEYEKRMAEFNEEKYPLCKTVLLKAEEGMSDLSSTAVRACLERGEPIDGLVPPEALAVIKKLLG